MAFELWAAAEPVKLLSNGLAFREWRTADAPRMSELFDTEQMNRWTPLPSPFTEQVAIAYVQGAHDGRSRVGMLQLAVCLIDAEIVGELLLFPGQQAGEVEMAYGIGAEYQGRGYATASVRAGLEIAQRAHLSLARLTIAVDNVASAGAAQRAGFVRTDRPLEERRRKGFVLQMATWEHPLVPGGLG